MNSNAYQKVYQLKRYHRRRDEAIAQLGGRCVQCQSGTDLQIDHIKPELKEFPIGTMWSVSEKRFKAELSKCQLLCKSCHEKKTSVELSKPDNHGSYWQYKKYGCRCQECRKAFTETCRIYKKRYKEKQRGP